MERGAQEFLLHTEVEQGVMETARFGAHFLTYVRLKDSGRVASLDRYENEQAAREGHLKWARKDWQGHSLIELLKDE